MDNTIITSVSGKSFNVKSSSSEKMFVELPSITERRLMRPVLLKTSLSNVIVNIFHISLLDFQKLLLLRLWNLLIMIHDVFIYDYLFYFWLIYNLRIFSTTPGDEFLKITLDQALWSFYNPLDIPFSRDPIFILKTLRLKYQPSFRLLI